MRQLTLFETPSLNTISRFKAAMREAVKASDMSRDQVADKMTALMKCEGLRLPGNNRAISRALMDKWLGDGNRHMIPAALIPVFCSVCKSKLPIQALVQPLDARLITEEQYRILKWGEAELNKRKYTRQARKLAEEID